MENYDIYRNLICYGTLLKHIVKDGYFILFTLHKYICVFRIFSLCEQIPAPSSPEKRGPSVDINIRFSPLRSKKQ